MKTLTIITTTYNRAHCLHQVYESLKSQDCKDFIWLIIDDGSNDNTQEVVKQFIAENRIEIQYVYQQNKGMTGARNTAYSLVNTEINTIIDSDDWMAEGAVNRINSFWKANKRKDIAGIIALNVDPTGKVIGTKIPEHLKELKVMDMRVKYKLKGDKKLIYRSDISRLFPYPEIEGEKFFPPSYKFFQIDQLYNMLTLNEGVCVVDYNNDSMSFDKISQYKSCAKGFAIYRNLCSKLSTNHKYTFIQTLHYISASIFAGNKRYIQESSHPILTILLLPLGLLFHTYLKHTKRKALSVPKAI